jgi:excisionase family DNA binding protein
MALNGKVDLRTAAEELGVHYQTAYRWVREGTLTAVKVGPSYQVEPDELDRLREQRATPMPPPSRAQVRSWAPHVERLYDALMLGDEVTGRQIVDRLHDGRTDVVEMCERLFTPALKRMGDGWARGRVSIADEHRAAAICTRLLARLSTQPRGRPRGVAMVTSVPGEAHELPGLMASLALRADRWRVHHLGTELPFDQLLATARRDRADLVVLSVTNTAAQQESRRYGDEARAALGARVIVGHPGATLTDLLELARLS